MRQHVLMPCFVQFCVTDCSSTLSGCYHLVQPQVKNEATLIWACTACKWWYHCQWWQSLPKYPNRWTHSQTDLHWMNKCRAHLCLPQLCCVHLNPLPCSWKYWRELNLAVGSQIAFARILTDLNLAVRYGIGIHIRASKKYCWILIWRSWLWGMKNRYYQLTDEVAWYCRVLSGPKGETGGRTGLIGCLGGPRGGCGSGGVFVQKA